MDRYKKDGKLCNIMLIWLIQIGEPLPIDGPNERLFRKGILSDMLARRGHEVVWWTSSFDHVRKRNRFKEDTRIKLSNGIRLICLHSVSYKKNVSFQRIINHIGIARKFRNLAQSEKKPDIILCSFPTIELSYEAVSFALKNKTPIVMDIEDLWPDIFLDFVPNRVKPIAKSLLWKWSKMNRYIFKNSSSIIAVSKGYLDWGLAYSGRGKKQYDGVFPLGYLSERSSISKKEVEEKVLAFGIEPNKLIFLFIGTFGRTYDIGIVVNAVKTLRNDENEIVQFVFCGYGEKFEHWKKLSQRQENIIFTGWIDKDQIRYLLHHADVGLAAYAKGAPQGLPNKLFEYMSAGLPILSSLQGEAEMMIQNNHCGYNYEADDMNDLLKGMRILFDEKLRLKMAKNSAHTFEKQFRADKVYNDLCYHLEKIHDLKMRGTL